MKQNAKKNLKAIKELEHQICFVPKGARMFSVKRPNHPLNLNQKYAQDSIEFHKEIIQNVRRN